MATQKYILALTGGVGGAKLALGLSRCLPPQQLKLVVNTGDDFIHNGFHISPDLDSVMYALAGCHNHARGWGLKQESWKVQEHLEMLGLKQWFQLGDKDIATQIFRAELLRKGASLTEVTQQLCKAYGIVHKILPMTDAQVSTKIVTKDQGILDFQDYFVKHRSEPAVNCVHYRHAEKTSAQEEFQAAFSDPDLAAVVICPSNPLLSVEPILALGGVKSCLRDLSVPVIAVSPIINGRAIKGPTVKIMQELGMQSTTLGVAEYYKGLITHFVIDNIDSGEASEIIKQGAQPLMANTFMHTLSDKVNLAKFIVSQCEL